MIYYTSNISKFVVRKKGRQKELSAQKSTSSLNPKKKKHFEEKPGFLLNARTQIELTANNNEFRPHRFSRFGRGISSPLLCCQIVWSQKSLLLFLWCTCKGLLCFVVLTYTAKPPSKRIWESRSQTCLEKKMSRRIKRPVPKNITFRRCKHYLLVA